MPWLRLAAVPVAVLRCRVLPQIPSQDGWRLPSVERLAAPSCSASRLNSHSSDGVPERSRVLVLRLPEAALVPGGEAAGPSFPLLICLLPEVLAGTNKRLRESVPRCSYRKKEPLNQPLPFYLNQLQPHELSAGCPLSSRRIWGQPVTCFASFLSSELLIAEDCIQDKVTVMADYLCNTEH